MHRLMRHIETNYIGQGVNSDLGHDQHVTLEEVKKKRFGVMKNYLARY